MKFEYATLQDVDAVLKLHMDNHVSQLGYEAADGFLASTFSREQVEDLITKEHRLTVARREDGSIAAYAMAASWAYWDQFPFFANLAREIANYKLDGVQLTTKDSYEYGPVCVAKSERGTGLFSQMFFYSLASKKDEYPIMVAFINKLNYRSYAAHTKKVPMTQAGTFTYEGGEYYLLACSTSLTP